MNRDFKGIWIPKDIWLANDLTVMEKLFLIEIDSLDNVDGCFASNQHFSEFFGLSKGRCTQVIKSLEEKKLVNIKIHRSGKQIIKRTIRVVNKLNRVVNKLNTLPSKTKYPYLENDEESNTSINNTYSNTIKEETEKVSSSQINLDEVIIQVETEKKEKEKTSAKKEKVIAFNEIKNTFMNFYLEQTGIEYSFTAKDAGSIKQLSNKIQHSIQSDGDNISTTIIQDNLSMILNNLPNWYKEKGLSLSIINSKYNEIINEIRTSGNNGINTATLGATIDRLVKD